MRVCRRVCIEAPYCYIKFIDCSILANPTAGPAFGTASKQIAARMPEYRGRDLVRDC